MNKFRALSGFITAFAMVLSPMLIASPVSASDSSFAARPIIVKADAKNTGGTIATEAGDSIVLKFSETTNKFAITADNIATELGLNNSHSFLDGAGAIGGATWSDDGKGLAIVLSAGTSIPTVVAGDTVTIIGTSIKTLSDTSFTGSQLIAGSFNKVGEGEDEDSNDDSDHHVCGNTLINGKLYKVGTEATVYLASKCILKPFRGEAVFHSRGQKFANIITLDTLPADVTISTAPVLPAEGTLVKGTDKTVWFVDHNGKRRGFISAEVFTKLGFKFDQVDTISNSDLGQISTDTNIASETEHPDGALIKCSNSSDVFVVIGKMRFPFANAAAFTSRGHTFEHILNVDCSKFAYQQGAAITK